MSEQDPSESSDLGNRPAHGSKSKVPRKSKAADRGKLKIGDDWNAIRIIALSQSNPLKAIAEFVENSVDAKAATITITRGREHGEHYLSIKDDGDGVPRDEEGRPNFKYVATHICDSIKRRLKAEGSGAGLQGLRTFPGYRRLRPACRPGSVSPRVSRNASPPARTPPRSSTRAKAGSALSGSLYMSVRSCQCFRVARYGHPYCV